MSSSFELGDLFRQHKFPYGFGFLIDKKINEHKSVVIAVAKEPGFLGNYKLSHVFDSGEYFDIDGTMYGDASLTEKYFPIGHSDDFLKQRDRVRRMHISDDAKRVIVAKFLRFAHPFNYFLTPAKTRHVCAQPVYKKDIGEDPRMISYVRQYLAKEYPQEYQEFVSKIMWYEDPHAVVATGKERIDITYGIDVKAASPSLSTPSVKKPVAVTKKPATSPKALIDLTKLSASYLEQFKPGAIAFQVLGAILNSGKVSLSDITKFKSAVETKAIFGFEKQLLSPTIIRANSNSKCYVKPFVLNGETLYMYSQWYDTHQERLIKWILNWISTNGGKI